MSIAAKTPDICSRGAVTEHSIRFFANMFQLISRNMCSTFNRHDSSFLPLEANANSVLGT